MEIQVRDPIIKHRDPRVFNPVVDKEDAEEILKLFGWIKKDESKYSNQKRSRKRPERLG